MTTPQAPGSDAPARGGRHALRARTRESVLGVVRETPRTQVEIARALGLSEATVSNVVRALLDEGLAERVTSGGKRRIRIVPPRGLVAGIDFGHRHVTIAIADAASTSIGEVRREIPTGMDATQSLAVARDSLGTLLERLDATEADVLGVGMGLPAPIDTTTGLVGAPSILPSWVGLDAATFAAEHLDLPVTVDNDANLGALGERAWGAARGCDDLVYLKLSDGVGAGLIVGGMLLRGPGGTAGEIGHTTVADGGLPCRCGNRGCLETLVAARAVIASLAPGRPADLSIADIIAAAQAGDVECEELLATTGRRIGATVATLCNILNPSLVLVGGELAQADNAIIVPLRDAVRRNAIPSAAALVDVRRAALGARAHVLGAIALARDAYVVTPSAREHGG